MKKDITSSGIFQLVETPSIDGLSEKVYSVLALYSDGKTLKSRFMYDVARLKARAEHILSEIKKLSPEIDSIFDSVCELL